MQLYDQQQDAIEFVCDVEQDQNIYFCDINSYINEIEQDQCVDIYDQCFCEIEKEQDICNIQKKLSFCKHHIPCDNEYQCRKLSHTSLLDKIYILKFITKCSEDELILYKKYNKTKHNNREEEFVCQRMYIALYQVLRLKYPTFVDGTHDPLFRFKILNNSTLLMIGACSNYIVGSNSVWYHDPTLKNDNMYTVHNILSHNKAACPHFLKTNYDLISDASAVKQYLRLSCYYPKQRAIRRDIIARIFANRLTRNTMVDDVVMINIRKVIYFIFSQMDECSIHDFIASQNQSCYQFIKYNNSTLAMFIADNGYIVPRRSVLYHNPTIVNKRGDTVQSILQRQGKNVPEHWSIYTQFK